MPQAISHSRTGPRASGAGLVPRIWAGLALLSGLPVPAEAGAWNQEAGHGLVVVDYTFSGGAKYFDGAGKLSPAAAYDKHEARLYAEYGVTDRLTAIVKPSLARISAATSSLPGAASHDYAGLGEVEAAAQLHLLTSGPAVLAAQTGFRLPGTTSRRNPAVVGNTSKDAELRLLAGVAFDAGPWPAFLDVEGAYRLRSSGATAEWRADATLGLRLRPRFMLLVQSVTTLHEGAGTAWFPAASFSKLGLAGVYDLTDRWSLELGLFETVWGRGALRERGGRAAVWYRF